MDAATAKRLGLRGSRTVGTVRRTLAAGSSTTITVALTSKAKQRLTKSKLKSFKATLTAKAGGVEARRRVTVKKLRPFIGIVLAALTLPASAHAAQPNAAQRALERELGPQAVVDIDAETGTPRVLARLDGTLSGPGRGRARGRRAALRAREPPALGLTEADLDTLQAPVTTTAGGVTEVRWRQAVDGIPAADSELRVNVTADGRVLNVLGSPAHGLDPDTTPRADRRRGGRAVQDAVGVHRSLPRDCGPAGATRATEYADGTDAELTLYKERLAWRVTYRAARDAVYDAIVDAETGRVVKKANLVKSAAGDALVWERYPGARAGGTAAPGTSTTLGYLTAGATCSSGPNVARVLGPRRRQRCMDAGEEIAAARRHVRLRLRAVPGRRAATRRTCARGTRHGATAGRRNRAQNGVQAFYFANRFHDHLRRRRSASPTRAFEGADRLILQTDDGAATAPDAAARPTTRTC